MKSRSYMKSNCRRTRNRTRFRHAHTMTIAHTPRHTLAYHAPEFAITANSSCRRAGRQVRCRRGEADERRVNTTLDVGVSYWDYRIEYTAPHRAEESENLQTNHLQYHTVQSEPKLLVNDVWILLVLLCGYPHLSIEVRFSHRPLTKWLAFLNVLSPARIDPPIHVEYLRSAGA